MPVIYDASVTRRITSVSLATHLMCRQCRAVESEDELRSDGGSTSRDVGDRSLVGRVLITNPCPPSHTLVTPNVYAKGRHTNSVAGAGKYESSGKTASDSVLIA